MPRTSDKPRQATKDGLNPLNKIENTYIAEGLAEDCMRLIQKCSRFSVLSFQKFSQVWRDMNMSYVYYGRPTGVEIAEFSEEAIHIAKHFMVSSHSADEEAVAGLFLTYAFLRLQPFKDFATLRIAPKDVPGILRVEAIGREQKRQDILYILGEILIRGPCHYHVCERERSIEIYMKKYFDGSTQTHVGRQPIGVFDALNEEVRLISDLADIEKKYACAKRKLDSIHERNLSYTDYAAAALETSLCKIVAGLRIDNVRKEYIQAQEAKNAEVENHYDNVSRIKQKAMTNAVNSVAHLRGVDDRVTDTGTENEQSPQKGKGKGKGKGRGSHNAKSLSQMIESNPHVGTEGITPLRAIIDITEEDARVIYSNDSTSEEEPDMLPPRKRKGDRKTDNKSPHKKTPRKTRAPRTRKSSKTNSESDSKDDRKTPKTPKKTRKRAAKVNVDKQQAADNKSWDVPIIDNDIVVEDPVIQVAETPMYVEIEIIDQFQNDSSETDKPTEPTTGESQPVQTTPTKSQTERIKEEKVTSPVITKEALEAAELKRKNKDRKSLKIPHIKHKLKRLGILNIADREDNDNTDENIE